MEGHTLALGTIGTMSAHPLLIWLVGLVTASPAEAETALLPDGRSLSGKLAISATADPVFQSNTGKSLRLLEDVHEVRFPTTQPQSSRPAVPFTVRLKNNQWITGDLVTADGATCTLATPWSAQPLSIKRSEIQFLGPPDGLVLMLSEDANNLKSQWVTQGTPQPPAARRTLSAAGQRSRLQLPGPIVAGRLALDLRVEDAAIPWSMVLEKADGAELMLERPGSASGAWQRLVYDFTTSLHWVAVDGEVIWSERPRSVSPLHAIRIERRAARERTAGSLNIGGLAVWQRVEPRPWLVASSTQDLLWLTSGDELAGTLGAIHRQAVEFQTAFGRRTYAWTQLRGVVFRTHTQPVTTNSNRVVRIWCRPAAELAADELEGVPQALDENQFVLDHSSLGRLTIPRSSLLRLRPKAAPLTP